MLKLKSSELPDEAEVIRRLATGDIAAFKSVLRHYQPILLHFIQTFTKSRERAEEIVQDIFLQIWQARDSLAEINNLQHFLYVVAKNRALNAIRGQMREKVRLEKFVQLQATQAASTQGTEEDWQLNLLEKTIRQLPPQQQKVWLLVRKQGLSYGAAAKELQLSKETVKKYLQYATASVAAYLKKAMAAELLLLYFTHFYK